MENGRNKLATDYEPIASAPPYPNDEDTQPIMAVPVAVPYDHYQSSQLDNNYPIYIAPSYTGSYRRHTFLKTTFKLIIFHGLNVFLGFFGFIFVTSFTCIGFALLPICCVGIIVLRVMIYLVRYFAELDVILYNFISPSDQHVYVNIPRHAAAMGLSGNRLSTKLQYFSPHALAAIAYFATIKFLFGILSAILLILTFSYPLNEIFPEDEDALGERDGGIFELVIITTLLFVIGIAAMHFVAKLSRASTKFFCCEHFSTYSYVNQSVLSMEMERYGTMS